MTGPGAGRGVDERLVEKVAVSIRDARGLWDLDLARAVLAAVWDDLTAHAAARVTGAHADPADYGAEMADDDLPAAQPTVDRDALAEALWQTEGAEPLCDYADLHETVRSTYQEQADALLASGVLTDAAQVRREVGDAIEDAARTGHAVKCACYRRGLLDAREAACSEEASDDA